MPSRWVGSGSAYVRYGHLGMPSQTCILALGYSQTQLVNPDKSAGPDRKSIRYAGMPLAICPRLSRCVHSPFPHNSHFLLHNTTSGRRKEIDHRADLSPRLIRDPCKRLAISLFARCPADLSMGFPVHNLPVSQAKLIPLTSYPTASSLSRGRALDLCHDQSTFICWSG